MKTVEEIKNEIEKLKRELELASASHKRTERNAAIRDLDEISDKEKIAEFDKIFISALSYVEAAEESCRSEDDPHYAFEEFMGIVARDKDKFWKYYNSLD